MRERLHSYIKGLVFQPSALFAAVFNRPSMITLPFVINLNVMRHETQVAALEVMTARYVLRIIMFLQRDS